MTTPTDKPDEGLPSPEEHFGLEDILRLRDMIADATTPEPRRYMMTPRGYAHVKHVHPQPDHKCADCKRAWQEAAVLS